MLKKFFLVILFFIGITQLALGAVDSKHFERVGKHWDITTTVHLADNGVLYIDMRLSNGRKTQGLTGISVIELRDSNNSVVYRYKIVKTISSVFANSFFRAWTTHVDYYSKEIEIEPRVVPHIKSIKIQSYGRLAEKDIDILKLVWKNKELISALIEIGKTINTP